MNYDSNARRAGGDSEARLKIASTLERLYGSSNEALSRLITLKNQLSLLFVRLESGEMVADKAVAENLQVKEDLANLIWGLEDWLAQHGSRN